MAIRDGDPLFRFELEARLLADQSPAVIAARMGISIDVVDEFEYWFFDVRDRLKMTGWIVREAIQRQPSGELSANEIGPFWRWVGFNFGAATLESFLTAVSTETLLERGVDAYWKRETPLDVDLKLLVLAQRLPVPKTKTQERLVARCHAELESAAAQSTEDLLTPLKLELLESDWAEMAASAVTHESVNSEDTVNSVRIEFEENHRPVVQTLGL